MNNTTGPTAPPRDDYTIIYVIIALLLLEGVLIVITNSLVYVLFAKTKKLRRKTNYCLISLATSDLLAGVLIVPLLVAVNYEQTKPQPNYAKWQDTLYTMDTLQKFIAISTILHILFATTERLFKIHFPFRYQVIVTWKKVVFALMTIWIVSLSISLVGLALDSPKQKKVYRMICMVVLGWFPFLIILVMNIHTIWSIDRGITIQRTSAKNTERNERRKRKQRRAVVVYLSMAVSFALACLPYFTLPAVFKGIPNSVLAALLLLKFCTSFVNPLLYAFFKTDFKDAFNNMTHKEETSMATQQELLTRPA